jgi:ribose 5-phosphate isomerase B
MVANKHKNIRAALCYNTKSTKLSRQHNNAYVMTIGARLTKKNIALKCVSTFLRTDFDGGRHLRRIKKI